MDWNDVRHYLALARGGSVRAAGASLGVSHSTVARRVEALEARLSTRLFDRTRDGYTLTDAGRRMMPGAERAEQALADLERALVGQDERLDGSVSLTCPDGTISGLLLDELAGFLAVHPGIELTVTTDARAFDLAKREADVAVRVLEAGKQPPDHLIGSHLAPYMLTNYVASAHAERLDPARRGGDARWVGVDPRAIMERLVSASSYPDLPIWGTFTSVQLAHPGRPAGLRVRHAAHLRGRPRPPPGADGAARPAARRRPLAGQPRRPSRQRALSRDPGRHSGGDRPPPALVSGGRLSRRRDRAFEKRTTRGGAQRPTGVVSPSTEPPMNTAAPDSRFWDDMAERYAAQPVELPDAFERKIEITRSRMRPDSVVLDVGCGTGSLALRLADAGAHVHGLDLSPEMVRIANRKAAAQGEDRVTFHAGPFESFDAVPPGSLDGLCAYSLLHLVADRAATLARIHALLKPGGFFISSTATLGDTWVPYRPIIAMMRMVGKAPYVDVIGRDTITAEVRAAGFVDLEAPDVGAKPTTTFLVATKPA